jgi:mono/diheme cytochrome c family protein
MMMMTVLRGAAVLAAGFTVVTAADADTPVERGRYLVETIAACGNCHTPLGGNGPELEKQLAGGMVILDIPPMRAVAPNITPDLETGIGSWTDDEIARAIREGIRPDGSVIGPPMPFSMYRGLADDDLQAMVAYLRTVAPVRNEAEPSTFRFPLPPAWGPPVQHVEAPPRTDQVAYGGYLAGPVGHCMECHTPMLAEGGFDYENRLGWGGNELPGPWGVVVTADLTPTRLGSWTDEEIIRAITQGISHDGRKLSPPMGFGYYAGMTPEDLKAIVAYLRTLPPSAD